MFNPFTFFIINGMSHCTSFISSYIALKFESIDRIHLSIDLVLKLCLPSTASFDLQMGWGGAFPRVRKVSFYYIFCFCCSICSGAFLRSGKSSKYICHHDIFFLSLFIYSYLWFCVCVVFFLVFFFF